MKKLFIILVLLSTSFYFVSCDKDEDTESPEMTTAIITGKVEAELDLSNTGIENAPQGTKLFARINAEDLVTNPINGYNYEDIVFETNIDNDGNYSFTINAGVSSVNVEIFGNEFRHNQLLYYESGNPVRQEKVYSLPANITTSVSKGTTRILDLTYF